MSDEISPHTGLTRRDLLKVLGVSAGRDAARRETRLTPFSSFVFTPISLLERKAGSLAGHSSWHWL
jgi:hypothetical protein